MFAIHVYFMLRISCLFAIQWVKSNYLFALPTRLPSSPSSSSLNSRTSLKSRRGGWCPYCNVTLRTYQRDLVPQLSAHSARLLAISPETPDVSLSTHEKAELTYTVLGEPEHRGC